MYALETIAKINRDAEIAETKQAYELSLLEIKAMKFTAREKRKIKAVFDTLRAKLSADLTANNSPYDNDLGCGNCGDTGPFHGLLYKLETLFQMEHN